MAYNQTTTNQRKLNGHVSLLVQGLLKDVQRELDESRVAQKEVVSSARESERRLKLMEAEMAQMHEVWCFGLTTL